MDMRVEAYNVMDAIRHAGRLHTLHRHDLASGHADEHAKYLAHTEDRNHSNPEVRDGAWLEALCIDSGSCPCDALRKGMWGLLYDPEHGWIMHHRSVSWMGIGNYVDRNRHRVAVVVRLG